MIPTSSSFPDGVQHKYCSITAARLSRVWRWLRSGTEHDIDSALAELRLMLGRDDLTVTYALGELSFGPKEKRNG